MQDHDDSESASLPPPSNPPTLRPDDRWGRLRDDGGESHSPGLLLSPELQCWVSGSR